MTSQEIRQRLRSDIAGASAGDGMCTVREADALYIVAELDRCERLLRPPPGPPDPPTSVPALIRRARDLSSALVEIESTANTGRPGAIEVISVVAAEALGRHGRPAATAIGAKDKNIRTRRREWFAGLRLSTVEQEQLVDKALEIGTEEYATGDTMVCVSDDFIEVWRKDWMRDR